MALASEFYLTLPSNTKVAGNTTSDFRVELPYPLDLQGEWVVGLAELQYPATYNTVRNCYLDIALPYSNGAIKRQPVNDGYYSTIQELVDALNFTALQYGIYRHTHLVDYFETRRAELAKDREELDEFNDLVDEINTSVHFEYVEILRKIKVTCHHAWVDHVKLDPRLQHILGMESPIMDKEETLAKYPPDLRAGMDSLFIYCNLISPQLVGDTCAKLLKVVPLQGSPGDIVVIDYPNIHYVNLLTTAFSSVEISIKGSDGQSIAFSYGKAFLKLHFKRKRLL